MAQPLKIAHPIIAALFPRDDVIDVLGRLVAVVDATDRITMQHQAAQLAPVAVIAALGGAAPRLVIGAADLALVVRAIAPMRQARAPGELARPFRLEGHARQNGARRTPRFQVQMRAGRDHVRSRTHTPGCKVIDLDTLHGPLFRQYRMRFTVAT